jgi:hypothetical protein
MTQLPLVSAATARMIGRAEKKVKNKANCEMRNMNSDEDLSKNQRVTARKTNPKSLERGVIRSGNEGDAMNRKITFGGIE